MLTYLFHLVFMDFEVFCEVFILSGFVHLWLELVVGGLGGGGGGARAGGVVRVVLDVLLGLDSLVLHLIKHEGNKGLRGRGECKQVLTFPLFIQFLSWTSS